MAKASVILLMLFAFLCCPYRSHAVEDSSTSQQLLDAALDKLADLEEEARTLEQQGATLSDKPDQDPENANIQRQHSPASVEALTSVRRRIETQERTVGELRIAVAKASSKASTSRSTDRADRRSSKRPKHDIKGKRPADSSEDDSDSDREDNIPADSKLRTIHAPKGGWIDDAGKVHQKHTIEHSELQKALDDFWSGYDTASKLYTWIEDEKQIARDRLREVDEGSEQYRQYEVELNTWETWTLAVSTLVALFQKYVKNTNRRGRLLHVKHKYGSGVARQYEEPDPHGLKGSKQDKLLQKAIRAHEQQKKNAGGNSGGANRNGSAGTRGRGKGRGGYGGNARGGYNGQSSFNYHGDSFQGGRNANLPPGFGNGYGGSGSGGSNGGPQCYTCGRTGHLSSVQRLLTQRPKLTPESPTDGRHHPH